jgi:hypothetical protein
MLRKFQNFGTTLVEIGLCFVWSVSVENNLPDVSAFRKQVTLSHEPFILDLEPMDQCSTQLPRNSVVEKLHDMFDNDCMLENLIMKGCVVSPKSNAFQSEGNDDLIDKERASPFRSSGKDIINFL